MTFRKIGIRRFSQRPQDFREATMPKPFYCHGGRNEPMVD